jgi:hypothetical protein
MATANRVADFQGLPVGFGVIRPVFARLGYAGIPAISEMANMFWYYFRTINRGEGLMSEDRKTLHQRIAELLKRHEQSKAELADLKARAKDLDRKFDVRRKIVVGAAVMAHANLHSAYRQDLASVLQVAVTRQRDREILPEFFPDAAPPLAPAAPPPLPTPPARPPKPPGEAPKGAAPA